MSAILGSKGGVKRIAVIGLGKKENELTPAALEAIGAQVGTHMAHSTVVATAVFWGRRCFNFGMQQIIPQEEMGWQW